MLTDRAAAYQTDESIAASQRVVPNDNKNSISTRFNKKARSHASPTSTTAGAKKKQRSNRTPYCFKCKREHRLSTCPAFAEIPVDERMNFAVRHLLYKNVL